MVKIKAHCPVCGEVALVPRDIELVIPDKASRGTYSFVCPACCELVTKPADDHIIELLLSGGVKARVVANPAEARERHDGPRLTTDDLLDFLNDLAATDFLCEHEELPCV